MIKIQEGQTIPLTLQVYSGADDLKVTCLFMDSNGKEIFRTPLGHLANGFYSNFDYKMPMAGIYVAQYLTDKPEDYEIVQDIFQSVPKPSPPEIMILGEVVSVAQWTQDYIIGEVDDVEET